MGKHHNMSPLSFAKGVQVFTLNKHQHCQPNYYHPPTLSAFESCVGWGRMSWGTSPVVSQSKAATMTRQNASERPSEVAPRGVWLCLQHTVPPLPSMVTAGCGLLRSGRKGAGNVPLQQRASCGSALKGFWPALESLECIVTKSDEGCSGLSQRGEQKDQVQYGEWYNASSCNEVSFFVY